MSLAALVQKSTQKWLAKRLPRARKIRLGLNNIFILPSRNSLILLVVMVLMLISAINYQNSLIYLFTFWLGAAWVVSLHLTFRALSGVEVEVIGHENCHSGQKAKLTLRVTPNKKVIDDLCFYWRKDERFWLSFSDKQPQQIELSYETDKRGPLEPERLTIEVQTPAGLAIAWSKLLLRVNWLIYPEAIYSKEHHLAAHDVHSNEDVSKFILQGQTDYSHLRDYMPGDHPKRIHWRHFAKTEELATRVFVDYQKNDQWIYWEEFDGLPLERRLSAICAKVLEFDQHEINYGMSIPGCEIQAGKGLHHKQLCLEALASYGKK